MSDFLGLFGQLSAQQDLMQYIGQGTPQSNYVNPAFETDSRWNLGLPFISSVSFHHTNFLFNPQNVFENTDQGVRFKSDEYLELIEDRNSAGLELTTDVFSVGFKLKENYFTFAIREKIHASINLPGDLLRFPVVGNANFAENGGLIDFSGLSVDFTHHAEYGFGWQTKFGENTSIGARAKLLFGRQNIETVRSDVQWQTDPETYEYTFSGALELNSSGVGYLLDSLDGNGLLENGEITRTMGEFKNGGLGIDLGIDQKVTDKLSISASVIDLGYISWKNTKNYKTSGEEFIFSGIEITENLIGSDSASQDSLSAALEAMVNDLNASYEFSQENGSYKTKLNTRVYIGAQYVLYDKLKSSGTAGLLVHSAFYNGEWTPTMSISYKQRVGKWLNAQLAYSLMKEDARNIGLGLVLRGGPAQFYVSMDNLMAMNFSSFRTNEEEEPGGYPAYSTNSTLHFGMNFLFGTRAVKTETAQSKY